MRFNRQKFRHFLLTPRLPAYGLVEILVALIVIGFLLRASVGQLFSGVDEARVKTALSQYKNIRIAVSQFHETYDALPGDFSDAIENFGTTSVNGNGDGILHGNGLAQPQSSESAAFWLHLSQAKLIVLPDTIDKDTPVKPNYQTSDSGFSNAGFSVISTPFGWDGLWLVLGRTTNEGTNGGAFTPLQAKKFLKSAGLKATQTGNIRIANGVGSSNCLRGRKLSLQSKARSCTVYFRLWEE